MKHIAAYINITTGRPICYMVNKFKFTLNPKEATEIGWNGFHQEMFGILNGIYNGNDSGNMTEHEYFHIREDYFKGIEKKDVMPTMTTKDNEILYMRKLKLLKIYENQQHRGTFGKDGKQSLKWVKFVDCEDNHLKAILKIHVSDLYKKVIKWIFC